MGLISYIALLFLSFFCLWRLRGKIGISFRDLSIGWGIKILFSTAFILIFSYYYSDGTIYGDAGNFLHDSALLHEFAKEKPVEYLQMLSGIGDDKDYLTHEALAQTNIWSYGDNGDFINDNRLIIRLNSVIHFFSFNNPFIHGLIMSFIGFIGLLLIYKSSANLVANKRFFYYAIIAFPSISFWGSGITKEALMLLGVGLFFFGIYKVFRKGRLIYLAFLAIGILILLFNKPYVGLIIIGLSPLYLLGLKLNWSKQLSLIIPVAAILGLVVMTYLPSKINLLEKISYKQKDLINMGQGGVFFITDSRFCAFSYEQLDHFELVSNDSIQVLKKAIGEAKLFGNHPFHPIEIEPSTEKYALYLVQPPSGSYLETEPINYKRLAMLTAVPTAFINTVIRPLPGDNGSALKYFAFLNNLLLIGFIFFCIFNRKKLGSTEMLTSTYLVTSACIILLIIGWTTPILGAIARYKMIAELLLIIALFIHLKPLKNDQV